MRLGGINTDPAAQITVEDPRRMSNPTELWKRYNRYLCSVPELGFSLDVSRMNFGEDFISSMQPAMEESIAAMARLEAGEIANPDENRMVGHYWLRAPELAPEGPIRAEIESMVASIREFAQEVHEGKVLGERGKPFKNLLVIGIGGSALGPQLMADALGSVGDRMAVYFCDNTDPDGFDRVIASLGDGLAETLAIVISKSGGTQETRNAQLEIAAAYEKAGLNFARAAVAVTGAGSRLDEQAKAGGWLRRLPMWDWVGGRTSVLAAVGLLPAALGGIDIDELLAGARAMDSATRQPEPSKNPAAMLALMWHHAGDGRGARDMVILPYKDRLTLFSKYLQQLVMESLGKERNLDGDIVNQGIAVYGNKGSTDQHAYVQQLRDGVNNFFVTFIEVLRDRDGESLDVEPGITAGDYLSGFLQGTRRALHENDRESMTITIEELNARTLGALIALFERAVGLYASLINVNAYHQPGVEAGKKAAQAVIELQLEVIEALGAAIGRPMTAEAIAKQISAGEASDPETETAFKILEHLAANPDRGVRKEPGATPSETTYWMKNSG